MDSDTVTNLINARMASLYTRQIINGLLVLKPKVCCVCDEYINNNEINEPCVISFRMLKENQSLLDSSNKNISRQLKNDYHFDGTAYDNTIKWDSIFLSKDSQVLEVGPHNHEKGLLICRACKNAMIKGKLPEYAIANEFYFGTPPECLLRLNEIERAFLSPVKTFGYCFCYTGGRQKELKGTLSYYRVHSESIVRTAAHFSALGMTDNIVILLYGEMTKEQKQKASQKNKMRTGYLIEAINWLCINNKEWKKLNLNINTFVRQLKNPTLIDTSTEVNGSTDNNIEKTESIEIFFPDSTLDICTGGQASVEAFKTLVQERKQLGYDFELRADLLREAVSDYKDNNLVNACLIQFPYGHGGLNEERELQRKKNGQMQIDHYLAHLSRIGKQHFHEELFVLMLYNMNIKLKMVKGATWKVRQETSAKLLATELTQEDIELAIRKRQNNYNLTNTRGDHFLQAIDAIGRGVPHTNEAVRRARRHAECMQHHFGMPTHFLTVTPDDDNSILLQIYSNIDIDINSPPVDTMNATEIENRANKRRELRIKYPGIAAIAFEHIMHIIIDVVIGWNMKEHKAHLGLFGTPTAFTATIEEQGRKTIHVHFQIWIKKIHDAREMLNSSNRQSVRLANKFLCQEAERTMRSSLFFSNHGKPFHTRGRCFPHLCTVPIHDLPSPEVVTDQQLRELRHKEGSGVGREIFASCSFCPKTWTYNELVKDYVLHCIKDPGYIACNGEGNLSDRMKAKALEYQKDDHRTEISSYVIECGYNVHSHTSSCFKDTLIGNKRKRMTKDQKKRARQRLLNCECRYRLPVRAKCHTVITNTDPNDTVFWYDWKGTYDERHIKELHLKRHKYDLFLNQSCPAIGESKLTCNTNINLVFYGSTGQYCFKYCTKDTQKDDRASYDRVMEQKDRILCHIPHSDSERTEAIRRLLIASFAHQKANVIGAPLSSFLTRNEERFIFSHSTTWLPLRDMQSLIRHQNTNNTSISYHGKKPFFVCLAMHYLARPSQLENTCAFDFYSNYEVIRVTKKNYSSLLFFHNTPMFIHPSFKPSTDSFLQGVHKRNQPCLIKLFQNDFPDTAQFQGDIFECNEINPAMETYAELLLLLFLPFRAIEDLQENNFFTLKLRTEKSRIEKRKSFLQNIEDAKSNCFRMTLTKDDLQRSTQPVSISDYGDPYQAYIDDDEDNEDDDTGELQGVHLDQFLNLLELEVREQQSNDATCLLIKKIKDKGRFSCGYSQLNHMPIPLNHMTIAIETNDSHLFNPNVDDANVNNDTFDADVSIKKKICQGDLVKLIIERIHRVTRSFKDITGIDNDVSVLQANGSIASIFDWAIKAKLDREQRRSFEIIIAHFLWTFITEAEKNIDDLDRHTRSPYLAFKGSILALMDRHDEDDKQLICLLYGPGGCGKTTVIDLVLEYAKEYCNSIDGIQFTSRTIVVTALTGVAATILRGETIHGAAHINQTRPLEPDQIEVWSDTRLLIVDEISFAGKKIIIELDNKLRRLKQNCDKAYGGLNIVFSGDFCQLEPVGEGQKPLYKDPCPQFSDWINCFIELKGLHRFRNDLQWGMLLRRFREGRATSSDIKTINSRVVNEKTILPTNLRYATYFNRDRDAINAALFEQRCTDLQKAGIPLTDSIIILSDNHQVQNGSKVYSKFTNSKKFWEEYGENDIKGPSRMDPVLRLFVGCRVMLPGNDDVKKGIANGTQAIVQTVYLKPHTAPMEVKINPSINVPAVFASQVEKIELIHLNDRISPRVFHVIPKRHTFKINIQSPLLFQLHQHNDKQILNMKAIQIPLLINNATTGHKLQGCGIENLFIHSWSYVANWVYVMLSRVKTLNGLYLRQPLKSNLSCYAISPMLTTLITHFRRNHSPTMWTSEQYDAIFRPYLP